MTNLCGVLADAEGAKVLTLYKLTFGNGKSYIGQTTRMLELRLKEHRKASNGLAVSRAWRKHGEPVVTVLATFTSQEQLDEAERAAIVEHCTTRPAGYNICEGGRPAPMRNPEVAIKVGAKLKGRVVSAAVRAKMSASARTRIRAPHSAETRLKIAESTASAWSREEGDRRSESLRAAHAARSPEERSNAAKRAWETKRAKGLAA